MMQVSLLSLFSAGVKIIMAVFSRGLEKNLSFSWVAFLGQRG